MNTAKARMSSAHDPRAALRYRCPELAALDAEAARVAEALLALADVAGAPEVAAEEEAEQLLEKFDRLNQASAPSTASWQHDEL